MEESKQELENPPSPPTKKMKVDSSNTDSATSGEPKKHSIEDVEDPVIVPCKKLKPDDTLVSSEKDKESLIVANDAKTVEGIVNTSVVPSVEVKHANDEVKATKTEGADISKETNQPTSTIDCSKTTEAKVASDDVEPSASNVANKGSDVKEVEAKLEAKPSPKVLKKLPGLNPIRPVGLGGPLQVNTEMPAPTISPHRATISPLQVSPGSARPQLSPGQPRQVSPNHARSQVSPVKQLVGASITPVRNKSPIAQLQKGGLIVSPVKQKSPQSVTISPVRQMQGVDMSPFLSGEITLSALAHQGVSITPSQPQLSAEIRSQIPEGISITAVPSSSAKSLHTTQLKAKSPVGPRAQKQSPPKAFGLQRPQAQVRTPRPRNALPEPGMIGRVPRTPMRQPAPRLLQNKPATPNPGETLKALLSQKPKIVSPPKVISPPKVVEKSPTPEPKAAAKSEVPAPEKKELSAPENLTEAQTKPEAVKPSDKSNDEAMDVSIDDKTSKQIVEKNKDEEQEAVKNKETEKNKETVKNKEEEKEESSSEEESEDESEEGKADESKDSKPTSADKKGTPASTPSRALRNRKTNIETNVAVKLTRIDDELEDGALPPWNLKKLTKSALISDAESADVSDDNSNSQSSKVSSTPAQGEAGAPKKRGRPRKTISPVRDVEDYTSHESLHEALKKIIADEKLEPADSDFEDEDEKDEPEGRRETKMLLAAIPFFSRRGGRAGMKGKAIGKNNQFDNRIVEKLEHDRRFRNEMLKMYQDDLKKREEKKLEKIAENEKKKDERNKANLERKEKLRLKAEERRKKYEEQKKAKLEEALKREEARKLRASLNSVQNFDDDTRMSFPPTPGTPAWKNTSVKFESLEDGDKSESKGKRGKMETIDLDSQKEFPVHGLAEYQWPLQGGEHFMIQEQVAAYLGVKSFKRKYPDLKRRGLEPEERTYICDSGLVSEAMIELGLTAVQSADIMDIMFVDFPEKYEEVKQYSREKQARELIDRQKAFYDTTISEQTSKDLKETLVEATALWNAQFNKLRRETRQCALDLQTFVVHYPAKANPKPTPKIGHYPVAILPGQYCDYYKEYTASELKYMPLNTVLYGPLLPNEPYADELSYSDQTDSDGDSDSDSSSSGSSGSSSSSSSSDSSSDDEADVKPLPPTPGPKKTNNRTSETPGSSKPSGPRGGDSSQGKQASSEVQEDESMEVETSKEMPSTPPNCKACDRDKSAGEMIRCGKCVRYLHPSCLDLPLEMLPHMRMYEWQCSDCKSCVTCELTQDDDKMLFCDLCDRGYHNYCIGLDKIPTGRWHCNVCSVCSVCKTKEPNPEWEHEVKKGPKGQSVYRRTLCTPCHKNS